MARHVQIRLDDELAEWFDRNYSHGFKQTFGENCFVALRSLAEKGEIQTTAEMSLTSVQEVLRNASASRRD